MNKNPRKGPSGPDWKYPLSDSGKNLVVGPDGEIIAEKSSNDWVYWLPRGNGLDDAPVVNSLMNAGFRKLIQLYGATYTIRSPIKVVSNLQLNRNNTKWEANVSGFPGLHDNCVLTNDFPSIIRNIGLFSDAIQGKSNILTTSFVQRGSYLALATGTTSLAPLSQTLTVVTDSVDNGDGSFTVQLDRSLIRTVPSSFYQLQELNEIISNVTIFGDCVVTGPVSNRYFQWIGLHGLRLYRTKFVDDLGVPGIVVNSFDNNCYDCIAYDLDIQFAPGSPGIGYFSESNDKCFYIRPKVRGVSIGIAIQDPVSTIVESARIANCTQAMKYFTQALGSGGGYDSVIKDSIFSGQGIEHLESVRTKYIRCRWQTSPDGVTQKIGSSDTEYEDCEWFGQDPITGQVAVDVQNDGITKWSKCTFGLPDATNSNISNNRVRNNFSGSILVHNECTYLTGLRGGVELVLPCRLYLNEPVFNYLAGPTQAVNTDTNPGSVIYLSNVIANNGGVGQSGIVGNATGVGTCVRIGENVNWGNVATPYVNCQLSSGELQLTAAIADTYKFTDINSSDRVVVTRSTDGGVPAPITWNVVDGVGIVFNHAATDLSILSISIGNEGARTGKIT